MIILGAYFIGVLLQTGLKLPVPGTVLGLIILFMALFTGIIKVEMVEDICNFFTSHMAFLFIPAGVGLMTSFDMLRGKVIPFIVIIITSTFVVWIVTAFVVKHLRRVCSK
jgi:Putative effector of murein hydrolase LrgA